MIPDVPPEELIRAIRHFDAELRDSSEWQGWEGNENHKYAIDFEGKRYPVKQIIRTATGFSDFSGGSEANSFVARKGFSVIELRGKERPTGSLQERLEQILKNYVGARSSEAFGAQSATFRAFKEIGEAFQTVPPVKSRPDLRVIPSAGQGNWARVPWISFLNRRETETTQKGVYCVYLFREDMSGIYLTFNQGVTEPTQRLGAVGAREFLRNKAASLRAMIPHLAAHGFSLDERIDLRAERGLGAQYEDSTIAYRFYPAGAIPSDNQLVADLDVLLETYAEYVNRGAERHAEPAAWIFQASDSYFDLTGALRDLREFTWLVRQHADRIHAEDSVFLWQAGNDAGVVALGKVLTDPAPIPQLEEERRFNVSTDKFEGVQNRVRVKIEKVLTQRVTKRAILGHPVLGSLTIITAPTGTNFRVTPEQARALFKLIEGTTEVAGRRDLAAVAAAFAGALRECGLFFGERHKELVLSFVASLATKRFVIITGLSGSGKTQIALRFGEWLGKERSLLVPVRPDWTGAEALFGYEDALQPLEGGRSGWHVPDALKFMLRSGADPRNPYVFILDEMNLAHVERYFADVLSGMESGEACLPNLVEGSDGRWRVRSDGPDRVPVPRNLFVIGTVNVDETTYMFSPKVLDRANTFEFRVSPADLDHDYRKPTRSNPGEADLVRGFLEIASDDGWQFEHPAPARDEFIRHLRVLHALLFEGGFEFGHRSFYEAVRFAAMLAAAGDSDGTRALDYQVLQKVLPRLHGSRRRLEGVLCALGHFCMELAFQEGSLSSELSRRFDPMAVRMDTPRLPLTFDKVRRMLLNLRANQFTSFTE